MGSREDLLKDKRSFGNTENPDFLAQAVKLCQPIFPTIAVENMTAALRICQKNNGLTLLPMPKPDFCFAFFRYWPVLIDAVETWDGNTLEAVDLRRGPILHVAALVTPGGGYSLTRELIDVLNPMAVSCHRFKNNEMTFHFKRNPRFDEGRVNARIN